MRPVREAFQFVQRCAVRRRRNHGAGGEIRADSDHVRGTDPGVFHGRRYRITEHAAVVLGNLQCPVIGQPIPAWHALGKDAMGVLENTVAKFRTIGNPDDDGTSGQGAEVDTNDILFGVAAD